MMHNVLFLFLAIFLYKLLINVYKAYRCNSLYKLYLKWLMDNGSFDITYTIPEVIDLLKDYSDNFVPVVQPAGLGVVHSIKANVLLQYPSRLSDIALAQVNLFDRALATYKYNAKQSLTPLYWLDVIIWFPKTIVHFLGINTELKAVKVCYLLMQLIYWCLVGLHWLGLDFKTILLQVLPYQ